LTTNTGYLERNKSRITISNIRDPIKEIQEGCKNAWTKEFGAIEIQLIYIVT
jgi:hypothetical protein